jgi:hypothetical protein
MKPTIITVARYFIAIVFIFSAVTKLIGMGVFEISLIDQGITQDRMIAGYLTRLLIGFEIFLGVSFFLPFLLRRAIIPLTLFTLAGFTMYLFYFQFFRADMHDCGCFGEMIKMTPFESILKNLALLIIVFFIYGYYKTENTQWIPSGIVYVICAALIMIVFPVRSVESLAFSKYTHFENKGIADLTQGDKLVIMISLDCEECQDKASKLSKLYKAEKNLPELYFFMWGEPDSIPVFMNRAQAQFPYILLSDADFFNMIGDAPPRLYWLQNGEVKEYWDKNILERIQDIFLGK